MAQFIKDRYGLLIDGQWVDAENGETFVTTNPASGEQLAVCANASPADVDRAVQAARKAFPAWAARSPAERAALLLKIAERQADSRNDARRRSAVVGSFPLFCGLLARRRGRSRHDR